MYNFKIYLLPLHKYDSRFSFSSQVYTWETTITNKGSPVLLLRLPIYFTSPDGCKAEGDPLATHTICLAALGQTHIPNSVPSPLPSAFG